MTKRHLLVTSALPYANGDIHLGHLVEHIQTDIFVRFQKLRGHDCQYFCADDTHGTAIMLRAEKEGVSPEDFIQAVQKDHVRDLEGFGVRYDRYDSTHCETNEQLSQDIYQKAFNKGAIITKEIDQYFCEETQLFLADRYIKGTCPKCQAEDQYGDACEACYATYDATDLIDPISAFSKKAPVLKSSVHYFFDLKQFEKVVQKWLATDPVQPEVKNKLKEWFDQGLKPWDISRDAPYFGFQIPGTTDKYFYVWMDAPVGYIATTKNWCEASQLDCNDFWRNPEVEIHHFIGKDILYFHTLFWPAMLHVADYQAPKKVHIHGFLTVNGEKMSKSRGTFILAKTYLEHLDPSFLRYYYATKLNASMDDMDLNLEDFMFKVNSDVVGKLINIGSRLGAILQKNCEGKLASTYDKKILNPISGKADQISNYYETLDYHKAMREIMACADAVNKYINDAEPWSVIKEDKAKGQAICTTGINGLRLLSIYLKPVIPDIVRQIEGFLDIDALTWEDLSSRLTDHTILPYQHIAQRLSMDDISPIVTP